MSADFTTTLEVRGTREDCKKILEILCYYANDRKKQYREQRDCWYLDTTLDMPENELEKCWKSGEMHLTLSGPYGIMNGPGVDDIDLFERIADVAPTCYYRGSISGWDTGGDASKEAELKDGKLYLKSSYSAFGEDDEEFEDDEYEDDEEMDDEFEDEEDIDEDDGIGEAGEFDKEKWDIIYDPIAKEYQRISTASEGASVNVTIALTDMQGRRHELVLQSKDIEWPINLKCFPKDLLAAEQTEKLIQLLMNSVDCFADGEAEETRQKISSFGEAFQSAVPDGKPVRLELSKIHDHKAPFFFGWLRSPYVEPELKKLAKKVKNGAEKNKQKNLAEFQACLEKCSPAFPGCEWTGWPEFCGFGYSIPCEDGCLDWNPETKTRLDWRGVACSPEEFAYYLCSKKEPREYAVEKVVVDYTTGTIEQTAVYMPGGPEPMTASAEEGSDDVDAAPVALVSESRCAGMTFVITGKVHIFTNRDAFVAYVESQGGKVSGSVSKNTNYLVNNDLQSASSKNQKAQELGIPIISENEFANRFGCP